MKFDPEVAWWAARHLGVEGPGDGPLQVQLQVANRDAFIGWVLGFGPDAEVLGPAELHSRCWRGSRQQSGGPMTSDRTASRLSRILALIPYVLAKDGQGERDRRSVRLHRGRADP